LIYYPIDDPWPSETNGRTAITTSSNDPWQATTTQINPWGGNDPKPAINDNGLSINISDPWGLGATNSQPTTSPPPTTKTIDNELSDFFGAGASKILFFSSFHSIKSFFQSDYILS
jgi:hypothetical protein